VPANFHTGRAGHSGLQCRYLGSSLWDLFPTSEAKKVPLSCADPLTAGGDAVGGIGVEMPRFGCGAAPFFSAGFCGREGRNRQHSTLRGPALGLHQESHGTGQESTSGNLGRRLRFSRRLGVRRRVPSLDSGPATPLLTGSGTPYPPGVLSTLQQLSMWAGGQTCSRLLLHRVGTCAVHIGRR
jgi:hypothetical protein